MSFFKLPESCVVNRVVPKNAFDRYTNSKLKKDFSSQIQRIVWTHKLAPESLNLPAGVIKEIQVFRISLKGRFEVNAVLEVINKAIPYPIVFWVENEGDVYLSSALKHPHPAKPDEAVVDWVFQSDWFNVSKLKPSIELTGNLDTVYLNICQQISGYRSTAVSSISELAELERQIAHLERQIKKLRAITTSSKPFRQKAEANVKLKSLENQLRELKRVKD